MTQSSASTAPTSSRRPPKTLPPSATSISIAGASNSGAGEWVPAQIYIEEEPAVGTIDTGTRRFKAQSRIWDYVSARSSKLDELTSILVDSASAVKDDATPKDISPLESQRDWEHQAEENLIERLEKGGLIAPPWTC